MAGSKRGIYIPRINYNSKKPLYITEGVSDLAVILECGLQGLSRPNVNSGFQYPLELQGIAIPNANSGFQYVLDWIEKHSMKGPYIIVADDDEPGRKGAWNMRNALGSGKVVVPAPHNDLYQYFLEVGKEEVTKWLQEQS
jgi:hypothetical protein